MRQVKVIGIKWEADDMDDVENLEKEMLLDIPEWVEDQEDLDNFVKDELSNITGFTHLGWEQIELLD